MSGNLDIKDTHRWGNTRSYVANSVEHSTEDGMTWDRFGARYSRFATHTTHTHTHRNPLESLNQLAALLPAIPISTG